VVRGEARAPGPANRDAAKWSRDALVEVAVVNESREIGDRNQTDGFEEHGVEGGAGEFA
jgi:hypothetical protein